MITWENVFALAPALEDVSAAGQAEILAKVEREVRPGPWGAAVDDGRLALARHLGVLALQAQSSSTGGASTVGPVQSETVGPVSRSFAVLSGGSSGSSGTTFDATSWGQEYKRMLRLLPGRFGNVI